MSDPRWLAAVDAIMKTSGWTPRPPGSAKSKGPVPKGRGAALGTHFVSHGGAIAGVEVDPKAGKVVVKQLWSALDCELVVNSAIAEAQIIRHADPGHQPDAVRGGPLRRGPTSPAWTG